MATPTPIPIFAPDARPELMSFEPPLFEPPLFEPPLFEPPPVEDESMPDDVLLLNDPTPVRDGVALLPAPPCVALPLPVWLALALLPPVPELPMDVD